MNFVFRALVAAAVVAAFWAIHLDTQGGKDYFLFSDSFGWFAVAGLLAAIGYALFDNWKKAGISLGLALMSWFVLGAHTLPSSVSEFRPLLVTGGILLVVVLTTLVVPAIGLGAIFGRGPAVKGSGDRRG